MMKIVHTKIFGLAAALFLFTACDKKSPENKPEGKNEQKQKTLQLSETFSSASDAQWVKVTEGLGTTLEVKNHPTSDNRLVYLNQSGQIGSYDTATQENNLLINLGDLVPSAGGEHGLLSVAFHPEFSNDQHPGHGKLYTYLTTPPSNGSPGVATILELSTEVNVDQIVIDRSLDRVVLEFDQPQGNHNGGTLLFGPHDGLLYLSTGDGGAAFDRGPGHNPKIGNSQDLSNLLGKVLRIDPLKNGQEDYSIPQDNPFVGQANTREEIFAFGLRNPFRMSFAELTPDTEAVILLGDVGQSTAEEINLVEAGGNYGWRVYEGANKTPSINDPKPQTPVIAPIAEYPQNIGRSVIGGQLYQGIIESLQNHYIFSDFFSSKTYVIKFEGSKATGFHSLDQVDNPGFVTSYLNDQSGEMWLSTFASGGALYRLEKKQ